MRFIGGPSDGRDTSTPVVLAESPTVCSRAAGAREFHHYVLDQSGDHVHVGRCAEIHGEPLETPDCPPPRR